MKFLSTFGGGSSSSSSTTSGGRGGGGIPSMVLGSISRPARSARGTFNRNESFGQAAGRNLRGFRGVGAR